MSATRFEKDVLPRLARIAGRVRWYVLTEGLAVAAAVTLVCFAVQLGLDRTLRLRVDLRAGLLAAVLGAIVLTLWRRVLRPLLRRVFVDDVAAALERRFPQIESRLISAVQFAAGRSRDAAHHSPALVQRVIEQAGQQAGSWPLESMLKHGRARGYAALLCAVLGVFVALLVWAPQTMGIWFERNVLLSGTRWPQQTQLVLLNDEDRDGVLYCPLGDDLPLRVRWFNVRPDEVRVVVDLDGGGSDEQLMTAVGIDEFRYTLAQVTQPLTLWISGGDAANDAVRVQVVERPRIDSARIQIFPPSYVQREPYELRESKSLIEVLYGSAVELNVRPAATGRVLQTVLYQDRNPIGPAESTAEGFRVHLEPTQDANYWFELTDERGLNSVNPRQFMVRMKADAAPTAALDVADAGPLITPQAVLDVSMTFADEYGLGAARLLHHFEDHDEVQVELPLDPGALRLTDSQRLRLPDLGAEEGQRLILYCAADDLNTVTGPGVGRSTEFVYRVVSPEELLAELARREQEFYQEFARLIETQEQLRGALLSVARAIQTDGSAGPRGREVAAAEQRQRQLARQVGHVGVQFQGIHAELVINQLDSPQVRQRLLGGIVEPLEYLSNRQMPQLADSLQPLTADADLQRFRDVDLEIALVVEEMRRILENMTKWEGFHESVRLLQTIVRMQRELKEETGKTLDQQFDELFGKEPKK